MVRLVNPARRVARPLGLASLFLFAAACEDAVVEPSGPDAAGLAEGTGSYDPATGTETRVERLGVIAYFEGYANPATGDFDVWMVDPDQWEVALVEDGGNFRRTGQALDDYCEAPVSNGVLNSVTLTTVTGSIALDDACPSGLDGSTVVLPYSAVNGAYCAEVNMRSNFAAPIRTVFAEITEMSAPSFAMYNHAFKAAFGLGNGAVPPSTTGNRTPVDINGGLVRYDDFEFRGAQHREWWIFQRPGAADFFFRGRVMYSLVEVINGLDDDCDGLIDEDTQSYVDGEECYTNNDCVGGICDCAGSPCPVGVTPVCRTPFCGDSLVEGTEECDGGGGGVDVTGCDFDCTFAVCGDDYVNTADGEQCDPGVPGLFTATCDNDCTPAECQDGLLNTAAGETCDDGNADNTDACLATCQPAYCGDGFRRLGVTAGNPGYEECDDANTSNNDACLNNCLNARCGDGWVRSGVETCDGDGLGTGGETATCDGPAAGGQACTPAVCGDNYRNAAAGEFCDQGAVNTATCDADCSQPSCGDAFINPNYNVPGGRGTEQCDLGAGVNSNDNECTADCRTAFCGDGFHRLDITNTADPFYEYCDQGPLNSNTIADRCRTDCTAARCGDSVIDSGEACDNGPFNSDTEPGACRTGCAWFSCGDGVKDPDNPLLPGDQSEACDKGTANSDTGSAACRTNCTLPRCGDGVRDVGTLDPDGPFPLPPITYSEPCDDGNTSNNDSCLNGCVVPTCGDGFVWNQNGGTETCDDSNATGGDGCSATCTVEAGWSCPVQGAPCVPICGDGLVRGSEQCDNGNTTGGDGCSATCTIETGWYCPFPHTSCNTQCGDGIRAGTETCDTGGIDTASCDAGICDSTVACGDGYRNTATEVCDDGNTSWNDACLGNCLATASCGDGWVQTGVEDCDGNGAGAGGETATCDGPGAGSNRCTFASCGDNYVNTQNPVATPANWVNPPGTEFEQCDNGARSDTTPNACRMNCRNAYCGDRVTDSGEQCDQGTSNSNTIADRCRTNCVNPFCGDGVKDSGEQCDGTSGVTAPAICSANCRLDADGDGYLSIANGGTDCDDNNAAINPGAAESSDIFDNVDSNCDGFNFSVTDTSIRIVQASSCVGSLLGSRCYQQTPTNSGLQNAINASSNGQRVLIQGVIEIPTPVILKDGVSIFGGWQSNWNGHNAAYRSVIDHYSRTTGDFQVVLYGHNLGNVTTLRYLNVRMLRGGSAPTSDALSLHGISVGQSNGFRLYDSIVNVANAWDGTNTNHGNPSYPTSGGGATNDCQVGRFDCTVVTYGGQGNGWQLWCPPTHFSYFYRGNSAVQGGGAGGSSIGVMLGRSGGAILSSNSITTGNGGAGGSFGGRGGQGGSSVPVWIHDSVPAGWSVAGSGGAPVDCSSNQGGNTMSFGSAGAGGAGTFYAGGRPGFAGRCHLQTTIFEWFYDCYEYGATNLRGSSDVATMAGQLTYKGQCSP